MRNLDRRSRSLWIDEAELNLAHQHISEVTGVEDDEDSNQHKQDGETLHFPPPIPEPGARCCPPKPGAGPEFGTTGSRVGGLVTLDG